MLKGASTVGYQSVAVCLEQLASETPRHALAPAQALHIYVERQAEASSPPLASSVYNTVPKIETDTMGA